MEPVFGGPGPATYRSTEAPVDWFQKRGEGYVHRVRITDPTSQTGVVHARDTWQHTTPLHGNSPSLQPKTKLLDVLARTSRPRAIMQTRRGAQKRGRDSGHPPTHESKRGNQRDISEISSGYQRDISEISTRHQRDTDEPDRRQDRRPTPPRHRHPPPRPRASPRGRSGTCRCTCRWRSCGRAAQPGCRPPSARAGRPSSSCRQPAAS